MSTVNPPSNFHPSPKPFTPTYTKAQKLYCTIQIFVFHLSSLMESTTLQNKIKIEFSLPRFLDALEAFVIYSDHKHPHIIAHGIEKITFRWIDFDGTAIQTLLVPPVSVPSYRFQAACTYQDN